MRKRVRCSPWRSRTRQPSGSSYRHSACVPRPPSSTRNRQWKEAIKAVLVLNGVQFGRTHDLLELGYRAEEIVPDVPFAIDRFLRLNPYAVAFRYGEPAVDLLGPEEAEELVSSVTAWAEACVLAADNRGY